MILQVFSQNNFIFVVTTDFMILHISKKMLHSFEPIHRFNLNFRIPFFPGERFKFFYELPAVALSTEYRQHSHKPVVICFLVEVVCDQKSSWFVIFIYNNKIVVFSFDPFSDFLCSGFVGKFGDGITNINYFINFQISYLLIYKLLSARKFINFKF